MPDRVKLKTQKKKKKNSNIKNTLTLGIAKFWGYWFWDSESTKKHYRQFRADRATEQVMEYQKQASETSISLIVSLLKM